VRLSELLGSLVVDEDATKLGHIFDVRVHRDDQTHDKPSQWRVKALVIGPTGILERVGQKSDEAGPTHGSEISWSQVLSCEDGKVIVRKDSAR
jgi:sporulation protein YlmC with PRC-barrel domain